MSGTAERPNLFGDPAVLSGFRRLGACRDIVSTLEAAADLVAAALDPAWVILTADREGEPTTEVSRGRPPDDADPDRTVTVPLDLRGGILGSIAAGFPRDRSPGEAEREFLLFLSGQLRTTAESAGRAESFLTDPLTGFRSHLGFLLRLLDEWPLCQARGSPLSLILLEVRPGEGFEGDREGLSDLIMAQAAGVLREETGEIDLVARHGSWTLEVLVPQVAAAWAARIARRLVRRFQQEPFRRADGEDLAVVCAVGVATAPEDASSPEGLLESVEENLSANRTSPPLTLEEGLAGTAHGRALLDMLSRVLEAGWDLDSLLDILLGMLVEIVRAERAFVLLRDPQGGFTVECARETGNLEVQDPEKKVSRAIARKVIETGVPIRIDDAGLDPLFADSESVAGLGLRAVLCVPIRSEGETFGCVYLEHRSDPGRFTSRHQDLIGDFARRVSRHLRHSLEFQRKSREVEMAVRRLEGYRADGSRPIETYGIVGQSHDLGQAMDLLEKVIPSDLPVHVTGESGTGKELVARAIHYEGPRDRGPFITENCAAIPESIFERELFGHVKGVFTGASSEKPGLIEAAEGGTLFLDEVGELSLGMQAKLLRVIEERGIRRLGGHAWIPINFRLVTASNRSLEDLVSQGRFREDLYYRLEGITIRLPPLRDRKEDIPLLVEHFLKREAEKSGGEARGVTRGAMKALLRHSWPGNVRELENTLRRACAIGGEEIGLSDLPQRLRDGTAFRPYPFAPPGSEAAEGDRLARAIEQAGGNKTEAARRLGISKSTLYARLRRIRERKRDRPSS